MEAPVSPSLASAPSTADVEGGKEETKVLDRKLIAKKLSPDQIEEGLEKACSVDLSGLRLAGSVRRGDALDACANLRTVNFSDNLLTEDDFGTDPLLLKQLRELVADGNRLTRVPRASWGTPGLPCLQHLSLANNSIESLVGFNALPLLRSLNLEGNRVASVKNLELAHLEVLNLSRNRIREVSGLKMARLEELKLAHNELTCFPGAERMAALRELDVSHNEIDELVSDTFASRRTTVALSPLRVLQHLTSLNARFNKLSSLAFLPPLPHLTELLLGHNRMGTPGPGAPPAPETAARAKSGAEIGRADDIGDAGYLTEEEEGEGGEEKGGPPSVRSGCSAASSAKRAVAGGPGRGRPVPSAAAAAAAGKVGAKRGAGGAAQKQRSGVSGSPAAAAPAAANLRRASKSDAGSASSTVSTAAAGGGGGSGARKNFIRQFPGHFPCLAVLDVSQNPGLVGSAEALRPLAKCKDLYDLRVAGSIAIGADDPNHLMRDIFGQVPHLDVIDGYTVVKVNRLEINDVDASATAAASPQEEITFTRTAQLSEANRAWSAPGLRPSTASSQRPSTASGRPPMRPLTSHARSSVTGTSLAGPDEVNCVVQDMMHRLREAREKAAKQAGNLAAALRALPADVRDLKDGYHAVNRLLTEGAEPTTPEREAQEPRAVTPTPTPTPPKDAKRPTAKRSSRVAVGPNSSNSNSGQAKRCSKPDAFSPVSGDGSALAVKRQPSFAEEASRLKARQQLEADFDRRILFHHVDSLERAKRAPPGALPQQQQQQQQQQRKPSKTSTATQAGGGGGGGGASRAQHASARPRSQSDASTDFAGETPSHPPPATPSISTPAASLGNSLSKMDERSIVQQVEPSHTPDVLVVGEEGSAEFPPREEDAEEQEEEEEGKPASDFDGEDSVVIPGCDPRGVQEKGSDADNGCLPSPALGSMRSIGGIPGVNGGTPNRGATPVKGVSVDLALQHRPRGAAKQSDSEGELSAAAAAAAASDAAAAAAAGKPGPKASNTQLISSLIARPAPKRQHALGDPKQQQQQAAAGPAAKKRSSRSLNSKVVPPKTANANISEGMACRPK